MNPDATVHHGPEGPDDSLNKTPAEKMASALGPTGIPRWCPPGYEILGKLGAGGNGQVFKARHVGLDRIVALKRLLNPAANREERDRFLAEARAVARLDHPNIIRIHDFGIHESVEWYTLEYCQRGSLAERLREGPLPLENSCKVLITMARAVGHAHQEGIIHRDIKPGNVLIAQGNTLKLADFGLARAADSRHSGDNVIAGTPAYMSPEQINEPGRVGLATDVWALGVMLYECLTGRVPFTGLTVLQVMQRISSAEPIPPRTLNEAIPPDLNTICLHALGKDPGKRYRSTDAMVADLEAWLEGRPIAARPVTRLERGRKWVRRNQALAWTLGALVAAILLGTSLSVAFGLEALREAALLRAERVRSGQALAESKRQERFSRLAAAQAAWDKFQWGRFLGLIQPNNQGELPLFEESLWRRRAALGREPLPVSSRPGISRLALGGNAWPVLVSDSGGKAHLISSKGLSAPLVHDLQAIGLEATRDGLFWLLTDAGEVMTFGVDGQKLRSTLPGPWAHMATAPDGSFLARFNDRAVEVLDKNFQVRATFTGETPRAAWSPGGSTLGIAWAKPAKVDIFRPGQPSTTVEGASAPFALSPDGKFLVAASGGRVHQWETGTGARVAGFEPRLGPCAMLAHSADGTRLLAAGGSELRLLDATRGRGLQFWMTPGTTIEGAQMAPDGTRALTWGDGIAQVWELDTGRQHLFRGVAGPVRADWEAGSLIHPSLAGDSWERRAFPPGETIPRRHRLAGWEIRQLAYANDQWFIFGKNKDGPGTAALGSDGGPALADFPKVEQAPPHDIRLANGGLERLEGESWVPWVRRVYPIAAWAGDWERGIIGLATTNGRVERIDSRTGTPIWEEEGPSNPIAMAMGKGGVGVAAPDGTVWIWAVP